MKPVETLAACKRIHEEECSDEAKTATHIGSSGFFTWAFVGTL